MNTTSSTVIESLNNSAGHVGTKNETTRSRQLNFSSDK